MRTSYININSDSAPLSNLYGYVSIQGTYYGTTCQGNAILSLAPNDYFEVKTFQNSGITQNSGGINLTTTNHNTNRIQITKLVIGPTGNTGPTGCTGPTGNTGNTGPTGNTCLLYTSPSPRDS